METSNKLPPFPIVVKGMLIAMKDNIPYIVLVTNKKGIIGLPGGSVDAINLGKKKGIKNESVEVAFVREIREEVMQKIFVRTTTFLYATTFISQRRGFPIKPKCQVWLFRHEIPYFDKRKIIGDDEIVEAEMFPLEFILNFSIDNWKKFNERDKMLLKKVRTWVRTFSFSLGIS